MKSLAIITILAIISMVEVHAKSHINPHAATLHVGGSENFQTYDDEHSIELSFAFAPEKDGAQTAVALSEERNITAELPAAINKGACQLHPIAHVYIKKQSADVAKIDHADNIYKTIWECAAISIALLISWLPVVYTGKTRKTPKQHPLTVNPCGQLNETGKAKHASYLAEIKELQEKLDASSLRYTTEQTEHQARNVADDMLISDTSFSKLNEGDIFLFRSASGNEHCRVYEMVFQSGNNRVILAATDKGIYKSFDAGKNWFLKSQIAYNM